MGHLLPLFLYIMTMLESLTDLLYNWCKSNELEYLSADDLLVTSYNELTEVQRNWLTDYIAIWDLVENNSHDITTNKLETFIPGFHD
tara:strand:- start:1882 stop:2142 length:261 start_codon:yes stop_codon:yes gene_type:complete